jgi:hypothetical protein
MVIGPSRAAARRGAPQNGSIQGTLGGQDVNLAINRRAQTVDGDVLGHDVHVQTSQDGKSVSGSDGDASVALTEDWQPTQVSLDGNARGGATDVHFDWTQKHGQGTVAGQPFFESWDDSNHVVGEGFGSSIDLQYDPISGHLQGNLGPSQLDVTVTNLDLTDVMQHVYLFAPTTR